MSNLFNTGMTLMTARARKRARKGYPLLRSVPTMFISPTVPGVSCGQDLLGHCYTGGVDDVSHRATGDRLGPRTYPRLLSSVPWKKERLRGSSRRRLGHSRWHRGLDKLPILDSGKQGMMDSGALLLPWLLLSAITPLIYMPVVIMWVCQPEQPPLPRTIIS